MAAVGAGPVVSLSQLESWQTQHLEDAAAHWSSRASAWEHAFTDLHQQVARPGGTVWRGTTADAAYDRAGGDAAAVSGMADRLRSAALAARIGAGDISWFYRR
jgi:hypothetical protein